MAILTALCEVACVHNVIPTDRQSVRPSVCLSAARFSDGYAWDVRGLGTNQTKTGVKFFCLLLRHARGSRLAE